MNVTSTDNWVAPLGTFSGATEAKIPNLLINHESVSIYLFTYRSSKLENSLKGKHSRRDN